MSKKVIRLTESDLHNIIKESVKKMLNEGLTPYLSYMAKKHGGIKWLDKNYQFDKLDVQYGTSDFFEVDENNDIPRNLLRFADCVIKFRDGKNLYAIKPMYHNNEQIKQMLKNSEELNNLRTQHGGYEPEITKYEYYEPDRGTMSGYHTTSPEEVRQRTHKKARGNRKPLAKTNGDSDYDAYVEKYLCSKFDGKPIYIDFDDYYIKCIVVPVDNVWGEEAEFIRNEFRKYGYGEKESISRSTIEDCMGDDFNPNMGYIAFVNVEQDSFIEVDDRRMSKDYGYYKKDKLPKTPKIGTSGFMKTGNK